MVLQYKFVPRSYCKAQRDRSGGVCAPSLPTGVRCSSSLSITASLGSQRLAASGLNRPSQTKCAAVAQQWRVVVLVEVVESVVVEVVGVVEVEVQVVVVVVVV